MKRILIVSLILGLLLALILAGPVQAIDLPDSDPEIESIDIWRNCLEEGDYFMMIYENTPYATPPDMTYEEAFHWDLYCTSNTTLLATTTGYYFHDKGYGYNVVGFYFDADEAPTWESLYHIRLTGTEDAFGASPPIYNFQVDAADYSTLIDTDDVLADISMRVIELAEELNSRWELNTSEYLTIGGVTSNTLSLYGESFFRGAIYGIQALAPDAFSISLGNITSEDREWSDNYSSSLAMEEQFAGTYLEEAEEYGEEFLDVDYNLMGLFIIIFICAFIIGACVYVGGDIWGSMIIAAGPLVIGGRLGLIGLGELGFIAAIMWIFVSGKIWKLY